MAGKLNLGRITSSVPERIPSPRGESKINLADDKKEGKTPAPKRVPVQKDGTSITFKITFFPDEQEDKILYFKNLHMFDEPHWVSFGIKPKAKDLKSVIDDLNRMEFLKNVEDYESSIALDGRKVRIGFTGDKLDPFYDEYEEQGEFLKALAEIEADKPTQTVFEFTLNLTQKLDTLMQSEEPLIMELCKGLRFE